MEPTALPTPAPALARAMQSPAPADVRPAAPHAAPLTAPMLDLSRMEPPRRLAEARLEEVTIDGICGVY
jgi:mycofactocin precursor